MKLSCILSSTSSMFSKRVCYRISRLFFVHTCISMNFISCLVQTYLIFTYLNFYHRPTHMGLTIITTRGKDIHAYLRGAWQCVAVLQCVAVCCSVLQCVAVCCSVLQCVADFFRKFLFVAFEDRKYKNPCAISKCCSVLQCVAVCGRALRVCNSLWEIACNLTVVKFSPYMCTHVCVCPEFGRFLHYF